MSASTHLQQLGRILAHTETVRESQLRAALLSPSLQEFLNQLQRQRAWWNAECPAINDFQRQRIAAASLRGLRDLDRELRVNNFLILGELGAGGMGVVHQAWSIEFEQFAAIKRLTWNNLVLRDRLEREAKILRLLSDPHIAQYLTFEPIEDGGGFLLAMEYVAGTTLRDYLQQHSTVDPQTVTNWAMALLQALSHAHARNVVHRDVTPRNIMVISQSGDVPVKLLDFGLGKVVGSLSRVLRLPADKVDPTSVDLTETGAAIGTPQYMSPEQFNDATSVTAAADIYSLGCNLFEMLAGQPPFPGTQFVPLLRAHVSSLPPDIRAFRSDIPAPLGAAIMRMLEKDPAKRPSADELRDLLLGRTGGRRQKVPDAPELAAAAAGPSAVQTGLPPQTPPVRSLERLRSAAERPVTPPEAAVRSTMLHPEVAWFRRFIPHAALTEMSGNIDPEVTLTDLYAAFLKVRKGLLLVGMGLLLWLMFTMLR